MHSQAMHRQHLMLCFLFGVKEKKGIEGNDPIYSGFWHIGNCKTATPAAIYSYYENLNEEQHIYCVRLLIAPQIKLPNSMQRH